MQVYSHQIDALTYLFKSILPYPSSISLDVWRHMWILTCPVR